MFSASTAQQEKLQAAADKVLTEGVGSLGNWWPLDVFSIGAPTGCFGRCLLG